MKKHIYYILNRRLCFNIFFLISGSSMHSVYVVMSILKAKPNKKLLSLDQSQDNAANTAAIHLSRLNVITSSVKASLSHGPKLGCPVSSQKICYAPYIYLVYIILC